MSLRTKLDLCRQVYQNCGCYMHLSGSTQIEQSLQVMLSAGTEVYGFTVSATTGNTVVVAIGQNPNNISASGLQINPDILPIDGGVTPDLGINITTGDITRDASSLRYKKNIQNLPYDDYKNILFIKVRSTGRLIKAKISINGSNAEVDLLEDEAGISPGQACVFYQKNKSGDKVLGGGWIDRTINKYLST